MPWSTASPSCRSCLRENNSNDVAAPHRHRNMSHCVSHTSPWVARNASASAPKASAAHHSISSKKALKLRLAAVLGGSAADAFLGTQGDVWDTQWDMFMALVGATSALLLLARLHDRQLAKLDTER